MENMSESLNCQFQNIGDLLKGAENVLIASHEDPDIDGVSSILSFHLACDRLGIKTYPYLSDFNQKYFNFLPNVSDIKSNLILQDFDLIFCLDYGDFGRLKIGENFPEERIITIDHHLSSDQRGGIKIVDPEFSSTAEIIYYLFEEIGIEIDREIALCLLSGIISDTGNFCHISTSPRTLKASAELFSKGVFFPKIANSILTLNNFSVNFKIRGKALSRVKVDEKRDFAYSWITSEDFERFEAEPMDLIGISSEISSITAASFSLFLVEYRQGRVKGSLRSEPYKKKSVVNLAKALGGNGHTFAAGFKQVGTVEDVLNKVYGIIDGIGKEDGKILF